MEATAQATQRKITLESLDLVHARRPEIQVFNELLVQYERRGERKPGQIVPDNMVVVWSEPITADGSYDVPLEPTRPFWVLEYVSKHNHRKDYEQSFDKYERELKAPYYLIFYPDNQELTLYQHTGRRYRTVRPNEHGRYALPELNIEVALLDGWVRYWYEGELLPLPADLQRDLDEARLQLREEKRRAEQEKQRAEQEKQRAEQEKQRAEEAARTNAELQQQLAEAQHARRALEQKLQQLRRRLKP
jgi:Uma2 family endonuclease